MKKMIGCILLVSTIFFTSAAFSESKLNLKLSQQDLLKILHPDNQTIESQTQKKYKFIIKVEHNSVLTGAWAKRLCSDTAATINSIYGVSTQSHCFLKDEEHPGTDYLIQDKISEINPDFQLNLVRELDGKIRTTLININQLDKNFVSKVGWNISYTQNFQYDLKEKLLASSFSINNLELIRDTLVDLIYQDANIAYNADRDGTRENFYKKLTRSKYWTPKTKKFLTVGSELFATLSFGWYGYNYLSTNSQDFDYNRENMIKVFSNKITAGTMFRYDDNGWGVNRNHVYAGVVYYLECRGAGFTALESYLCSIAGSTAWETLVEWREVFSINDQIFTSTGGAILAESLHQMGNYIDHKAPKWFRNTIGWAWKSPKKLAEAFNGKALSGHDTDIESADDPITDGKFEIEIGTIKTIDGKSEKRIGIHNEVNLIPFSVEPGHEVRFIKDIVETQFTFDAPTDAISNQYDIFAKVVMAAYYNKKIDLDANKQLTGYSFYVGASAALDIKNNQASQNDFMGIVHIIGTTAKITNYYKGFKITSSLDFWGDSVMMKSFMIEKYKAANGAEDIVKTLGDSDYYHGWGTTTQGQVILEYGKWSAGVKLSATNAINTNARQRDLGVALKQLDLNDQIANAEIFIECAINANIKIRFAVERNYRAGEINGFGNGERSETRQKISLIYYF